MDYKDVLERMDERDSTYAIKHKVLDVLKDKSIDLDEESINKIANIVDREMYHRKIDAMAFDEIHKIIVDYLGEI